MCVLPQPPHCTMPYHLLSLHLPACNSSLKHQIITYPSVNPSLGKSSAAPVYCIRGRISLDGCGLFLALEFERLSPFISFLHEFWEGKKLPQLSSTYLQYFHLCIKAMTIIKSHASGFLLVTWSGQVGIHFHPHAQLGRYILCI